MNQLSFFDAPATAPVAEQTSIQRHHLLAKMGAAALDNFTWWCINGNREMCAAVLWREHGFTQIQAKRAVLELAKEMPA